MAAVEIHEALEIHLGWKVRGVIPVTGGDINDAYRVSTTDGTAFVKTSSEAAPGTYRAESAGLRWLGGAEGGVHVPDVLGLVDPVEHDAEGPRLLALEWLEPGPMTDECAERLGRRLAATHAAGAAEFGGVPTLAADGSLSPQLEHRPLRIGPVALPNDRAATFAEFYGQCRLLPLIASAVDAGTIDHDTASDLLMLVDRLPELVGPEEPPARTHGDLWTGNVLAGPDGVPHLIDPMAHGGHREVDLAVLQLFGTPGERCFDAYDEVAPLAPGAAERVALFQLAVVLLHVVLFGSGYVPRALAISRRYL